MIQIKEAIFVAMPINPSEEIIKKVRNLVLYEARSEDVAIAICVKGNADLDAMLISENIPCKFCENVKEAADELNLYSCSSCDVTRIIAGIQKDDPYARYLVEQIEMRTYIDEVIIAADYKIDEGTVLRLISEDEHLTYIVRGRYLRNSEYVLINVDENEVFDTRIIDRQEAYLHYGYLGDEDISPLNNFLNSINEKYDWED